MKDLTIGIVAYNDEVDVRKIVETIETYTSPSLDKLIYLIDNSTKQNDIESIASLYDDVVYIRTGENLGFGKGHNYILSILDSKYHAIVNPDIVLNDDVFSPLLSFMNETGCGISAPRLTNEKGETLAVYRKELTLFDMFIRMFVKGGFKRRRDLHTMQDMDYTKPFKVPFAQGSFLVIRTDLLRKLDGFDDRYFLYLEDADLCRRVNMESSVMYCPYASAVHKWEQGSHKNWKLFRMHVRSTLKYFKKWGLKFS